MESKGIGIRKSLATHGAGVCWVSIACQNFLLEVDPYEVEVEQGLGLSFLVTLVTGEEVCRLRGRRLGGRRTGVLES